jgi:CRISPR-associated endonuclease/helicase Cas3
MDFAETFFHLTNHQPMPWQARLFGRMRAGEVPPALDLPTGLGKTSVMAIWLVARLDGAPLPRRLVHVVDRRVVVDQATTEAEKLAGSWLALTGRPLPVSTLRGRHLDNRAWLEDPAGEAIVVGTVDMVGSRLLFQGHGVSAGMRPYQAGLLGTDVLAVLDEAHLCPAFEALLRRLDGGDGLRGTGDGAFDLPGLRLMSLSATGRNDAPSFGLAAEDRAEGTLSRRRLLAAKRLTVEDAAGKPEEALADRALALAAPHARIAVFCTSREVAQKVLDRLRKRLKRPDGRGLHALTGARRVLEREKAAADLAASGFIGDAPVPEEAVFLVATAAGEVGVDLDADHAVMDLVAAERMIQRLGRVNRRGRDGHVAQVAVLDAPARKGETEEEAARRAAARRFLESLPRRPDGGFDASPAALAALKADPAAGALLAQASTPAPLHPPLDRPVVDAWAMTGLREHPGRPDIRPWLRGWPEEEDKDPDVTVLWRGLLPWRAGLPQPEAKQLQAYLDAAPPQLAELLEAPRSLIMKVLSERLERCLLPEDAPAALLIERDATPVPGYAWTRRALRELLASKRDRDRFERDLPGRILILAAGLGGIDGDGLPNPAARGWTEIPAPDPLPKDDEAEWPGALGAEVDDAMAQATGLRILRTRDPAGPVDPPWRPVARIPLADAEAPEGESFLVVLARRDGGGGARGDRAVSRRALELAPHLEQVEAAARDLAGRLGLPAEAARALAAAAALHDLGKARERWQRAMGAPPAQIRAGRVYAKTEGVGGNRRLLEIGGETYRHEFGSLLDAEGHPALAGLSEGMRDLALHLVAAHHGHARPVIAAVDPDHGPDACAEAAREAARRFVRLQRIWGPWGLAWWEALLRAADARASRAWDAAAGTAPEGTA